MGCLFCSQFRPVPDEVVVDVREFSDLRVVAAQPVDEPWIALSMSKVIRRASGSLIMLCSQKNEETRAPLVTGVTRCRLLDG